MTTPAQVQEAFEAVARQPGPAQDLLRQVLVQALQDPAAMRSLGTHALVTHLVMAGQLLVAGGTAGETLTPLPREQVFVSLTVGHGLSEAEEAHHFASTLPSGQREQVEDALLRAAHKASSQRQGDTISLLALARLLAIAFKDAKFVAHVASGRATEAFMAAPPSNGFEYGVVRAIDALETTGRRLATDVVSDLRPMTVDRLKVRLSSESTSRGSLPLKMAGQMMLGLRSLLISAAHMESVPAPSHIAARKRDAEFGDACRLGQTEFGSFIINIEIPVDRELVNGVSFSNLVVQRIMHGLHTVTTVREPEQLVEAYSDGMNANMLEAMLELKPDSPGFELDIGSQLSDPVRSVPSDGQIVHIAAPHFDVMEKGARQLRALSEAEEQPYRGRVRTLVSNTGQVNIDVEDGKRGHQLHAKLTQADYRRAVRAHDAGEEVVIVGKVSLHGGQRWIDKVLRFEAPDEDA